MYSKFSIALVLVTALSVSESAAQSNSQVPGANWGMGSGMMGGGMGPNGRGRFAVIDLNDDGQISDEEAASAALDVFLAMDADDDGELTKEEYMTVRMGYGQGWKPARQAEMQERKSARFGEMDTDKNGSVSRGEFLDAAKAHHASADADGDGNVSPWEHRRRNWY
ncbi:EF-hand domain-containing protein [Roseibium litorale]|uniref:EF-hand domain-containing protein n=1 Tax=Roseibium litorale TaxID=2803841 RepID=A0ABR9CP79_9HYPH|nr:EF-hand domain-containing protein [Roseibium litorale]MBD8892673.1 EF-hand domain-containing protein [Roseibium litorale]